MSTPRSAARALAAGQPGATLAIPRALHVSARIAERDAEDFVCDATQLANALRDLIEAVGPDGVPVTDAGVLLAGYAGTGSLLASEQLSAALEATGRLRASYGDAIVLAAVLPGPAVVATAAGAAGADGAAADAVLALGREFLAGRRRRAHRARRRGTPGHLARDAGQHRPLPSGARACSPG